MLELQELQPMLAGETWYFEHRQQKRFKQKIRGVFEVYPPKAILGRKIKHRNAQDQSHCIQWVSGHSQKYHMTLKHTDVCTTEYHTIFYHSYFMSQVYIMDYYWFFGKVFPCSFSSCGVLRLDLAYSSIFEA